MDHRHLLSYASADLAGTHPSTAGTQTAVDAATVDRLFAALERDGYVVVESLLPPAMVDAVRDDLLARFTHAGGRNPFEGYATQRLYALVAKTTSCDPLVEHPLVLALLDRLLEPNYLLSQAQAINIQPGEAAQALHYDDGFYRWPRPRPALGAATIWAIDDFTTENGATVVVPGSHRWGERLPSDDEARDARPVVMPRGSVVLFLGTLWHGGGANRSPRARLAVTAQYCAPWCRPQESFLLSVPRERARTASPHLQRMLGYSIHPPFMGFVDGVHPRRVLE
jgi:ectoine hydroxylase-related dioxygenase (phytanoyl-CoA dioxygenase family)